MTSSVQITCFVLALGLAATACGSADAGSADDAITEALYRHVTPAYVDGTDGIVVQVDTPTCPAIDVDGATISGTPSVDYIAALSKRLWAQQIDLEFPGMFGDAWPNVLRPLPLYCVFPTDTITARNKQADIEAAALAQLGPRVGVTTLYSVEVTRPSGHQCTPCRDSQ